MKRHLFVLSVLLILLGGCGSIKSLDRPAQSLGNNRYQIEVKGAAGFTIPSKITEEWNIKASQTCNGRKFDVIERSFTGKEQNGMQGMIECK